MLAYLQATRPFFNYLFPIFPDSSNRSETSETGKTRGSSGSSTTSSPSVQAETPTKQTTNASSASITTTSSISTASASTTTTTTTTTRGASTPTTGRATTAQNTTATGTGTASSQSPGAEGAMSAPSGRQVPKRRMRRRATSQSQDPAEQLTEMSVRGLNLFRYASISEGVYQCTECAKLDIQKTFKNKYSFQRHAFLYHEGHQRKVFPCPVCGKEFSRPDKMKNHMKTVHDCFMPKDCVVPFGFFLPP